MKELHKQSSVNHRRDEEILAAPTSPCSPKTLKHPRLRPKSINYLFKEQRLLFILVGILIGSTFFILQPTLSHLGPSESNSAITNPSLPVSPQPMIRLHRIPRGILGLARWVGFQWGLGTVGLHKTKDITDTILAGFRKLFLA